MKSILVLFLLFGINAHALSARQQAGKALDEALFLHGFILGGIKSAANLGDPDTVGRDLALCELIGSATNKYATDVLSSVWKLKAAIEDPTDKKSLDELGGWLNQNANRTSRFCFRHYKEDYRDIEILLRNIMKGENLNAELRLIAAKYSSGQ